MPDELIPRVAADSKAIEEAAKTAGKAINAAVQAGKYVGEVLGDLPHDLVGIMGDWVKHKRARIWAELSVRTNEILRDRKVENREDVSPSVAIPLIAGAINEDRDGLKELWARLLANAMDPSRTHLVRPSLIELLKQLDPLDALVLQRLVASYPHGAHGGDLAQDLAGELKVARDEAMLSLEHLHELGCLVHSPNEAPRTPITAKAIGLVRAVSD
jgi:hypothetical protein